MLISITYHVVHREHTTNDWFFHTTAARFCVVSKTLGRMAYSVFLLSTKSLSAMALLILFRSRSFVRFHALWLCTTYRLCTVCRPTESLIFRTGRFGKFTHTTYGLWKKTVTREQPNGCVFNRNAPSAFEYLKFWCLEQFKLSTCAHDAA